MRTSSFLAGALALLGGSLSAQIQMSVQAANDAGIALERPNGTRAVQSFPAGTVFTAPRSVHVAEGRLGGILGQLGLGASMHLHHFVSPPGAGPFGVLPGDSGVQLTSSASAVPGASFGSLHTSGDPAGNPGAQRYDVTLTNAGPTSAEVVLRVQANLLDPSSTASIRVTGGGIQETWTWSGPTTAFDRKVLPVQFRDSLVLRVEMSGLTPGGGVGGAFGEGFDTTLRIHAKQVALRSRAGGPAAGGPRTKAP
jgi:hypothetical protein